MFDFRYHALTIVSVFLALMIGLLLGIAIGDAGLVSSAGNDVRASLRKDVREARADAARLRVELRRQKQVEEDLYPLVVSNRLPGVRVGLIGLGGLSNSIVRDTRLALRDTGGSVAGIGVLREPVDEADLPAAPSPRSGRNAPAADPVRAASAYGRAVGLALMRGGKPAKAAVRTVFESSSGAIDGGLDAIVLYRSPPTGMDTQAEKVTEAFEDGLVAGLSANQQPVVGVEQTTTSPSQIPWYTDHKLPSVDNIDQLPGRASLVLALAGANGAYGVKDTAEELLPSAVG
ncbi:MAG: copper transporter [Solirubrobacteraceae bacterium]